MSARREQVRAEIEAAFAGERYPEAELVSVDDGPWLVETFDGTPWRAVPASALPFAALSFFTPEGFCYFLPAFLLGSLAPESADVRENLLRALMAPQEGPAGAFAREQAARRVPLLSAAQRLAVRSYLRFVAETYANELRHEAARFTGAGNPWMGP